MIHTAFPTDKLEGLSLISSDFIDQTLHRVDALYQAAVDARQTILEGDTLAKERSWRGMLVGAAALVKLNGEFHIISGYNTKKTSAVNCPTRKCAEERILEEIDTLGSAEGNTVKHIIALMVIGDFQIDDTSGQHCTTLHPCGSCRRKLEFFPMMHCDTIIITAEPPQDDGTLQFAEIHTRDSLISHHKLGGISV